MALSVSLADIRIKAQPILMAQLLRYQLERRLQIRNFAAVEAAG
jgi:hypothetical protein